MREIFCLKLFFKKIGLDFKIIIENENKRHSSSPFNIIPGFISLILDALVFVAIGLLDRQTTVVQAAQLEVDKSNRT